MNTSDRVTEQMLDALKLAYRKHHIGDENIGWEELSDALWAALCEAMGDKGFQTWSSEAEAAARRPSARYAWGADKVAERLRSGRTRPPRDFA